MRLLRNKILIIVFMCLLTPQVVMAWDSGKDKWAQTVSGTDSGTDKIVLTNDIATPLANIVRGASGLMGVIFFVMTTYAGMLWLTAAGSDEKISKAKKLLVEGVIGVMIALSAFAITLLVSQKIINASTNEGCCKIDNAGCLPSAGEDLAAAKERCRSGGGTWVESTKSKNKFN